jgi:Flp pilus assembly protein TadG
MLMTQESTTPSRAKGGKLHVREKQCGATLVEFAMVLMLLLTLVFGIMAFGHALYAYHFVNNTAKEATRWAAVNGSTCGNDNSCNGTNPMNNGPASKADIDTYVQTRVPLGINPTKVTTTVCGVSGGSPVVCAASPTNICTTATPNAPGCTVQVQVTYQFSFLFPLMPAGPLSISSTSQMIVAH